MKIFGVSATLIIAVVIAYIVGAKYPGLFNKAKAVV